MMKTNHLIKTTAFLSALFLFLSVEGFCRSVSDWRKDIQVGDILYDPDGFVLADTFTHRLKTGHIGIYVGDIHYGGVFWPSQMIEASLIGGGVYHLGIESWDFPYTNSAQLLRVPGLTNEQRHEISNFVLDQLGKPYSLNYTLASASPDNEKWYCSELVWAAYMAIGIDLSDKGVREILVHNSPVSPMDIYTSRHTVIVDSFNGEIFTPSMGNRVHNISLGKSYGAINEALVDDELRPGDIIELDPGGYLESFDVKTSFITIRARQYDPNGYEAKTVIRATIPEWKDYLGVPVFWRRSEARSHLQSKIWNLNRNNPRPSVIVVEANNVTIKGLTLFGAWGDKKNSGIRADKADGLTIKNCILFHNPVGLGLNESSGFQTLKNTFAFNTYGIGMFRSYRGEVFRNTFRNSFERAIVATEDSGACAAEALLEEESQEERESSLSSLRSVRDGIIPTNLSSMYYEASPALKEVLSASPEIETKAKNLIKRFLLKYASSTPVTDEDVEDIHSLADQTLLELSRISSASSETERLILEVILLADNASGKTVKEIFQFQKDAKSDASDSPPIRPLAPARQPVVVYLNEFRGNKELSYSDYPTGLFYWYHPEPIEYQYNNHWWTSPLGNFWDGYQGKDVTGNGVGETSFHADLYPLVRNPSLYFLEREEESTPIDDWLIF